MAQFIRAKPVGSAGALQTADQVLLSLTMRGPEREQK